MYNNSFATGVTSKLPFKNQNMSTTGLKLIGASCGSPRGQHSLACRFWSITPDTRCLSFSCVCSLEVQLFALYEHGQSLCIVKQHPVALQCMGQLRMSICQVKFHGWWIGQKGLWSVYVRLQFWFVDYWFWTRLLIHNLKRALATCSWFCGSRSHNDGKPIREQYLRIGSW